MSQKVSATLSAIGPEPSPLHFLLRVIALDQHYRQSPFVHIDTGYHFPVYWFHLVSPGTVAWTTHDGFSNTLLCCLRPRRRELAHTYRFLTAFQIKQALRAHLSELW